MTKNRYIEMGKERFSALALREVLNCQNLQDAVRCAGVAIDRWNGKRPTRRILRTIEECFKIGKLKRPVVLAYVNWKDDGKPRVQLYVNEPDRWWQGPDGRGGYAPTMCAEITLETRKDGTLDANKTWAESAQVEVDSLVRRWENYEDAVNRFDECAEMGESVSASVDEYLKKCNRTRKSDDSCKRRSASCFGGPRQMRGSPQA